jgi:hypothetical protein
MILSGKMMIDYLADKFDSLEAAKTSTLINDAVCNACYW